MFDVIGRQTVVQFVKTKSATQYVPFKSSVVNVSLSWVVNSKSGTSSDIVVSIFSPPPHADNAKRRMLEKANNLSEDFNFPIVSFLSERAFDVFYFKLVI